jgi:hypothetical protein
MEPATIVSASKIAVVEFHGFKDNQNRFVIKEFAIVSRYFHVHLIFEAPYDESRLNSKMQRTARWLTRHFHFIKWNARGIPYDEELIRALCKPFTTLYTNGSEKANFLKEFHDHVEDIKGSKAQSSSLSVTCILPQHNRGGKCALRSANVLFKWMVRD